MSIKRPITSDPRYFTTSLTIHQSFHHSTKKDNHLESNSSLLFSPITPLPPRTAINTLFMGGLMPQFTPLSNDNSSRAFRSHEYYSNKRRNNISIQQKAKYLQLNNENRSEYQKREIEKFSSSEIAEYLSKKFKRHTDNVGNVVMKNEKRMIKQIPELSFGECSNNNMDLLGKNEIKSKVFDAIAFPDVFVSSEKDINQRLQIKTDKEDQHHHQQQSLPERSIIKLRDFNSLKAPSKFINNDNDDDEIIYSESNVDRTYALAPKYKSDMNSYCKLDDSMDCLGLKIGLSEYENKHKRHIPKSTLLNSLNSSNNTTIIHSDRKTSSIKHNFLDMPVLDLCETTIINNNNNNQSFNKIKESARSIFDSKEFYKGNSIKSDIHVPKHKIRSKTINQDAYQALPNIIHLDSNQNLNKTKKKNNIRVKGHKSYNSYAYYVKNPSNLLIKSNVECEKSSFKDNINGESKLKNCQNLFPKPHNRIKLKLSELLNMNMKNMINQENSITNKSDIASNSKLHEISLNLPNNHSNNNDISYRNKSLNNNNNTQRKCGQKLQKRKMYIRRIPKILQIS